MGTSTQPTTRTNLSHRLAVLSLGCALAVGAPVAAFAAEGTAGSTTDEDAATATASAAATTAADADAETGAASQDDAATEETVIELSDDGVLVNGSAASTDSSDAVYTSHDVVYYEDRDTYDSGNPYGEGTADERHSAEDAAAVTVVNITEPGTYRISGTLSAGQISVDLGEDAYSDPDARVTLILDGVDITCEVAPALVFYNVYECDGDWSTETASPDVDTSDAGAVIVLADGSVNNVTGSHVARIYEDTAEGDKLWKIDSAIHSFMSMNVDGEEEGTGVLNVVADNEGIESDLHLTFNGGNVNIESQDDGVNSNEDGVSVTTVNGGSLHILAGLGSEGDGIDSNGYLVVNGGTVIAMANPASDSGLDSDMGSYINGGTVVALGSTMDWAESDSDQVTMNLQFASSQDAGDAIVVTDEDGTVVFAYDPSEDETAGSAVRNYLGAVVSCANFEVGATYHVYVGGTVEGDEVQGVYDVDTVTGYEGGVQQAYTGTDVASGPGGMMGRGGMGGPGDRGDMGDMGGDRGPGADGDFGDMPEGRGFGADDGFDPATGDAPDGADGFDGDFGGAFDGGQRGGEDMGASDAPEPPEGASADGTTPEGEGGASDAPEPPADADDTDASAGQDGTGAQGDQPEPPDGATAPENGGEVTADGASSDTGEASTEFYMQDKVNAFSGVTAAA